MTQEEIKAMNKVSARFGGFVFPHEIQFGDGTAIAGAGLTTRDFFAALAMQGEIAHRGIAGFTDPLRGWTMAQWAYCIADMMLQERAKLFGEKK